MHNHPKQSMNSPKPGFQVPTMPPPTFRHSGEVKPSTAISSFIPKDFKNKHKPDQDEKNGIGHSQITHFTSYTQLPQGSGELRRNKSNKNLQIYAKQSPRAVETKEKKQLKLPQPKFGNGLRQTHWTSKQGTPKSMASIKKKINQFRIVRKLGNGQFGEVYLSVHIKTGLIGALKKINKQNLLNGDQQTNLKTINQVIRQIKIQFYMNHPNLIAIYDCFADNQNIYLFMQYACDGELYSLFSKGHIFSEETTSIVIREITQGIEYMHERRLIHRDVKLENIVLSLGMAKLCDFGWSVYCPKEFRSTLCGTPLYLSPQILTGQQYNKKVDSWAIGSIAHQLSTGFDPFRIQTNQDLNKVITQDFEMTQGSPQLRSFVTFILRKNHTKRPDASTILMHPFIQKFKDLQTSDELIMLIQKNQHH